MTVRSLAYGNMIERGASYHENQTLNDDFAPVEEKWVVETLKLNVFLFHRSAVFPQVRSECLAAHPHNAKASLAEPSESFLPLTEAKVRIPRR